MTTKLSTHPTRSLIVIPFPSNLGTSITWSNMPAAVTEFNGDSTRRFELPLTSVRHFVLTMAVVAAATNAKLGLQYSSLPYR